MTHSGTEDSDKKAPTDEKSEGKPVSDEEQEGKEKAKDDDSPLLKKRSPHAESKGDDSEGEKKEVEEEEEETPEQKGGGDATEELTAEDLAWDDLDFEVGLQQPASAEKNKLIMACWSQKCHFVVEYICMFWQMSQRHGIYMCSDYYFNFCLLS